MLIVKSSRKVSKVKIVKFNKENVKKEEIEKVARKSRGIVINEEGKALLVQYAGFYMFPGGKIEEENPLQALHREVLEESGIETIKFEEEPFLKIESYDRNYLDRRLNRKITRLTETYFFYGTTDQPIQIQNQHLTQNEKEQHFQISFKNLSIVEYLAENNPNTNPKNEFFKRETCTAVREFAQYKREKEELVK